MTNDIAAQLAILASALTQIVDLPADRASFGASSDELLNRAVDIAARGLVAAATYGQLPPFKATDGFQDEAHG